MRPYVIEKPALPKRVKGRRQASTKKIIPPVIVVEIMIRIISLHFARVGLEFFPVHAVIRRFMLGTVASLEAEYEQLVEALTA